MSPFSTVQPSLTAPNPNPDPNQSHLARHCQFPITTYPLTHVTFRVVPQLHPANIPHPILITCTYNWIPPQVFWCLEQAVLASEMRMPVHWELPGLLVAWGALESSLYQGQIGYEAPPTAAKLNLSRTWSNSCHVYIKFELYIIYIFVIRIVSKG